MRGRISGVRLGSVVVAAILIADPGQRAQVMSPGPTLIGWAMLPADTFSPGPTSGQFIGPGQFGRMPPFLDKQPVQGFSAVIEGPTAETFYVLSDNGFGTKANSADALLRVYAVYPQFRSARGGLSTVGAADFRTGRPLPSFSAESFITLNDPDRRLGFPVVAASATYPGTPAGVPVDPLIRDARLLTGADLDPESFRRDRAGHFWFGDEFGPFLIRTDARGTVLGAEVPLDGVWSPDNPHRDARPANLARSRGFEGLARNPAGTRLYPLVEGTIADDPAGTLRMFEFDVETARYTGRWFAYGLADGATNIGDMTAIDDERFLVLERNDASGSSGPQPPFKRVFLANIGGLAVGAPVPKTEVADLMRIADPDDLNRDGQTGFTFPFITIEDILVIDRETVLIINDNNYPGGGGRRADSDDTEFVLIHLPRPL